MDARWSTIINTPAPKLNVALDTALHSIAASSKQLKGCFVEGTFTTRNLAPNDIKQVVDEVNKISHKAFGEEKDLSGFTMRSGPIKRQIIRHRKHLKPHIEGILSKSRVHIETLIKKTSSRFSCSLKALFKVQKPGSLDKTRFPGKKPPVFR